MRAVIKISDINITEGDGTLESNYKVTDKSSNTSNIQVGEYINVPYSGNDIDLGTSSTKTFIDVETIENPTVSNYYWTMNRYNSLNARRVDNSGNISSNGLANTDGVRAVLYLKSGASALTFTGGNGTAQSLYELN